MSFRTRLTSFFVLIVVIPMLAVGFLVFRLISDSQQGKADARANGLATAAAQHLQSESARRAAATPQVIARAVGATPSARAACQGSSVLASQAGLARVAVTGGSRTVDRRRRSDGGRARDGVRRLGRGARS